MTTKLTLQERQRNHRRRVRRTFPNIRVVGNYQSSTKRIQYECNKHGVFFATPASLLSTTGGGCKRCRSDLKKYNNALKPWTGEPLPKLNLIAQNWRYLLDNMTTASEILDFNPRKEVTPRTRLLQAKEHLTNTLTRMRLIKVARLGRFNIVSEIGSVINTINGLNQGIEDRALSRRKIAELLEGVNRKIKTISVEFTIRANKAANDEGFDTTETASPKIPVLKHDMSFDNFADAMKTLLREYESEEKTTKTNTPAYSKSVWEIRDEQNLENINKELSPALTTLNNELKTGKLGKNNPFIFVHSPIVVSTQPQLREDKLIEAGVKHQVISFPGIRYGAGPGGKKEYIPNMFVLSNQLLVAIVSHTKSEKSTKSSKKVVSEEQIIPSVIRRDVIDIMKVRTGKQYLDPVKESSANTDRFISSRKIPGVTFVWLLPKTIYNKIGPFSVNEIGLPF